MNDLQSAYGGPFFFVFPVTKSSLGITDGGWELEVNDGPSRCQPEEGRQTTFSSARPFDVQRLLLILDPVSPMWRGKPL